MQRLRPDSTPSTASPAPSFDGENLGYTPTHYATPPDLRAVLPKRLRCSVWADGYVYLSCYDRFVGRTLSVYVGKPERITEEQLRRAAEKLELRIRNFVPPIPRHVRCPRCGR